MMVQDGVCPLMRSCRSWPHVGGVVMKIAVEIPKEAEGLPPEEIEQAVIVGLREIRIERALVVLRKGAVSIGKAASMAGLSLREMIEEARRRGVEPAVTDEMIGELKG